LAEPGACVDSHFCESLEVAADRLLRSDLEGLLGVLGDAHTHDGPLPLTVELVERLAALMRCEWVTFHEYDFLHRVHPLEIACAWDPNPNADLTDAWWDEASPMPPQRYPRGVAKWSDTQSQRPFVGTQDEHWGVRDEISICLDAPATSRVGLVFHTVDRDFDERDRQVALALEPHIVALDRNAHARRRVASLLLLLEGGDAEPAGLMLLARNRSIEHASPVARDLLEQWFGGRHGHTLPSEINDWLQSDRRRSPLELSRYGRRLLIEATSEDTLLITEQTAAQVALTRRERDVLRCIAAGKTTAETAHLLWITPATVSKHLEHVYSKLGVNSRTAALAQLGMTLH
jgi:DNA-binding CsgD family transcriptional regulator